MSYKIDFNKNVRDVILYMNRCNLPEYNSLESLRALRPDPCPICHVSPEICCERSCAGHGEYYEYIYIRCRSCGLSLRCSNYTSVSIWNRLLFMNWSI